MSNTPNPLPEEVQEQISKVAKNKSEALKDYRVNSFRFGYRDGYFDGATDYALKLQRAEEMMGRMAKVLEYLMICDDLERQMTISAVLTEYNNYKQTKDDTANG